MSLATTALFELVRLRIHGDEDVNTILAVALV